MATKKRNGIIIPMQLKGNEIVEDLFKEISEEDIIEKNISINDELLINCSHELKTPLNIIYGAAQMIELSARNISDDNLTNYVNSIKNNCFRLTKYINHILDLTAIEAGEYKLNLERVNIVEVVEYVVQKIAPRIKEMGLNILFDTNVEEKYVIIDSELFGKSILNIISNAVKFSKQGGTILVEFTDYKTNIEIKIEDNGIGIDTKYLEKIFHRFGQVDKSLSRGSEGSGIGLKLAKAIIELHGGKVSAESKLNEGSTFSVKIPLGNKDTIHSLYKNDDVKVIDYDTINQLVHIEFSDIFNIS
ncbi:HAMP domain-containing histidine kinase [Sedimentibacter hydroxybenzoicus DSM 7310]|uniref:histidine kinase n=1 Tax=Sedimentibacter hydroxybenzoicus DSM 7310 TaxID=1123245 RepID=A0A974GVV9_SEDHY|nr:HAMP domain-containing sensor histidine kinase [Sedimentibacter hydroxybenzoicus]NYB73822.1 HAMP domain-containing histidine kinase [Sedimentibacter hydroxybenzoicus DSM 7310]